MMSGIALQGRVGYNVVMKDDDFQDIVHQIGELEDALQRWDCRGYGVARLTWLHDTIVTLRWASQALDSQDEDKRAKYDALEHRARQCREIVLGRKQKMRNVTIVVIVIAGIVLFAWLVVWRIKALFLW